MLMQLQPLQERAWGRIVARAWSDQEYKRLVLSEPGVAFAEHGVELPEGIKVVVHECTEEMMEVMTTGDSPSIRHLYLPDSPDSDLIEEELVGEGVDSTAPWCYCGYCGRCGRCGCGCGGCA